MRVVQFAMTSPPGPADRPDDHQWGSCCHRRGTARPSASRSTPPGQHPVIAYDRLIRDNENVDFYVSFGNFKVGWRSGQRALLYGLGLTDRVNAPRVRSTLSSSVRRQQRQVLLRWCDERSQALLDDGTLVVKSSRPASSRSPSCAGSGKSPGSARGPADLDLSSPKTPFAGVTLAFRWHLPGHHITALQGAGYGLNQDTL